MQKEKPLMGCVNCGKRIWLYMYFKGPFLCEDCLGRAANIILRLKKRLTKRAVELVTAAPKLEVSHKKSSGKRKGSA